MTIETTINVSLDYAMWDNYLNSLINKFFKILPIIENNEESIDAYLESLQAELIGLKSLIIVLDNDPAFISLLSVLSWIMKNTSYDSDERVSYKRIRREVFHAISICKKIREQFIVNNSEVI